MAVDLNIALDEIERHAPIGRAELEELHEILSRRKVYESGTLLEELRWCFVTIAFDEHYYASTAMETVADHFECIIAARRIASKTQGGIELSVETEVAGGRTFLVSDVHHKAVAVEKDIFTRFPDARIESHRSARPFQGDTHLRMYFILFPRAADREGGPDDFDAMVSDTFIRFSPRETYERYKAFWLANRSCEEPRVAVSAKDETGETRVMVILPEEYKASFFTKVSNVFDSHGITSNRKYVEPFSDGRAIYSFYLPAVSDPVVLESLSEDIVLATIMPDNDIEEVFAAGGFNAKETFYAMTAGQFVHQFVSTFDVEFKTLVHRLEGDSSMLELVHKLRSALAKDTYTSSRIARTCAQHMPIIKELYRNFDMKFSDKGRHGDFAADYDEATHLEEIEGMINRDVPYSQDRDILRKMIEFNRHVLKTNFYKDQKTSIAFRLDPGFMNTADYLEQPYGIIFIYGKEFHGFHVRFRDIARGGVRLVMSRDKESYERNSDYLFDENYGLAHTQQRKNKDIPEGGSKGIILLRPDAQHRGEMAFRKYIDGILDLILGDPDIVDHYGKEELLFLGPDEGTAEMMEWAALRARDRGYRFWKAFTTGKPPAIGGIPHDVAGMTTNSVHQYVLDILDTLGIREEDITKVQTGGPDGDLGSNEILLSKDRTVAVVDGSGVLFDPAGIDRDELRRLAGKRVMIEHFDLEKVTPQGFRVLVSDNDVVLPDGEVVASGLDFRNRFHLTRYARATLFSPNGGRPGSVNMGNVRELLDEFGVPKFKLVVEGANLFLTQDARLWLEERGLIVIKDASANKGGVTSSSLEVLAALALDSDEFARLICVSDGEVPEFRRRYVEEALQIIRRNASMEFAAMHREHKASGTPYTLLSDQLSNKINLLTDRIAESELYEDGALLKKVLANYVPPVLQEQLGLDTLVERVPMMYLRAIMATEIARTYVYRFGLSASEIEFFNYLQSYA